jgi:hypothetical protein
MPWSDISLIFFFKSAAVLSFEGYLGALHRHFDGFRFAIRMRPLNRQFHRRTHRSADLVRGGAQFLVRGQPGCPEIHDIDVVDLPDDIKGPNTCLGRR